MSRLSSLLKTRETSAELYRDTGEFYGDGKTFSDQDLEADIALTRRVVFPLQFDHYYVINITRTTKYKGKEFPRNN